MKGLNLCFITSVLLLMVLLFSCSAGVRNKKSVVRAMHHYDHLILKLDADSIALLFTPNGHLGTMAIGRDSIRKFLSSFKNIRVLEQSSKVDSSVVNKNLAILKGRYHQTDLISEKDTVKVKGSFVVRWIWNKNEGWRILQIDTKSEN